mmetsp:Transcript_6199/g.5325  ORF Transcript_6199/g.5325 Transcript_6199/m.5325 type:complete len:84 (+) Transcript_6199:153-404(+)
MGDYITFELTQFVTNTTTLITTDSPVPFTSCKTGSTVNFKYKNQTEVEKLGINDFFCPTSRNLSLLGNTFSEVFHSFEVTLTR